MNEKCEHDNTLIVSDRDLETGDVIFKTLCKIVVRYWKLKHTNMILDYKRGE